ncbi:hypothetical protein HMPREF1548_03163 [Clostridium sp. KLE 1755]|nr:hypothetical protein HMPREF1548_03163 [Clostridium sp. KLE 1755]
MPAAGYLPILRQGRRKSVRTAPQKKKTINLTVWNQKQENL